jgi:hypothetical protein
MNRKSMAETRVLMFSSSYFATVEIKIAMLLYYREICINGHICVLMEREVELCVLKFSRQCLFKLRSSRS